MKFYQVFLALSILLYSCDSGNRNQSRVSKRIDSTNVISKSIDSSAFDLLINRIEDPERKEWQNPDLVLNELGDIHDKTVVDIGAGTGYFTFRLAPIADKVIAIDIDERFLEVIDSRKSDFDPEYSDRIETRLTKVDDPLLKPQEADVVLIVNTYHFLTKRIDYLEKIKKGMKPGGIILIVDFKNSEMEVAPPGGLVVTPETATEELRNSGFKGIVIDQLSLKYQYIIKARS